MFRFEGSIPRYGCQSEGKKTLIPYGIHPKKIQRRKHDVNRQNNMHGATSVQKQKVAVSRDRKVSWTNEVDARPRRGEGMRGSTSFKQVCEERDGTCKPKPDRVSRGITRGYGGESRTKKEKKNIRGEGGEVANFEAAETSAS